MILCLSFSLIKDVIVALAAIAGSIAAIYGLFTWKHKMYGKGDYEIGRRILRSLFELRNEISKLRNPSISAGELENAIDEKITVDFLRDNRKSFEAEEKAYYKRWEKLVDAMNNLNYEMIEGKVLWGEEIVTKKESLNRCYAELGVALRQYLKNRDPKSRYNLSLEELEKVEGKIWEYKKDAKEETFDIKLNKSFKELENYLREKIEK